MEKSGMDKLWGGNYLKIWSSNFMIYFSFMLLTPLLPIYLNDTFGADKQQIGVALAGYTLLSLMIRPFSGYIIDSFSRKKVLLISYSLMTLLFIFYPICGSVWAFAIVRSLHGAPFGLTTVSCSTIAIDVLPSSRRAEGIGYYGLSNNIASAIAPTLAIVVFGWWHNYSVLFCLSFFISLIGLYINTTIKVKPRAKIEGKRAISLDRFILIKAWKLCITMLTVGFSYGIITTYVAIYGREYLKITSGSGIFFMILAIGLMLARLTSNRALREGRVLHNAIIGMFMACSGYLLFATIHTHWSYYLTAFIIGFGNGRLYPAFQTMFLEMAGHNQRGTANSTLLVSWDVGFGIGVLLGGLLAEISGYFSSFWMAMFINIIGIVCFMIIGREDYIRKRVCRI
jgi:MFS family permease